MLAIVPCPPDMRLPLVDMWRASFEPGVGIVDPHRIEEQRHYFEPMMQREDLRYESH